MSEYRSPVDLVYPKVNEHVSKVSAHNLLHPIKYKVGKTSENHVTLIPDADEDKMPTIKGQYLKHFYTSFIVATIWDKTVKKEEN